MHTKEPWIICKNGNIVSKELKDKGFADYICQMPFSSEREMEQMPEAKANAILISVAPSLLKVCDELLFVINKDKDNSYFICEEAKHIVERLSDVIDMARKTA